MADTLTADNKAATTSSDGDGQGVKFSEDQQKYLNDIIEKRLARSNKESKKEVEDLRTEKAELIKKLEEANTTLTNSKKGSQQAKDATEDIEIIKNQLEEFQRSNKQLLSDKDELRKAEAKAKAETDSVNQRMLDYRKKTEMQFSAQKQPFVNLKAVVTLTEDSVKYDSTTDTFIVTNDKGGERLSTVNVGEPMTLDEFYAEYAQTNKYLVRSDAVIGTGSTESTGAARGVKGYKTEEVFGPGSSSVKAAELARVDKNRYRELKQDAIQRGLIS